jgi:hypothetical protein
VSTDRTVSSRGCYYCPNPATSMRHDQRGASWTRTWDARWLPVCVEHAHPEDEGVGALLARRPDLGDVAGAAGVWAFEAVRQG